MYCVKCKRKTETTNTGIKKTKNNHLLRTGICKVCGKKKTQFAKSEGKGLMFAVKKTTSMKKKKKRRMKKMTQN